MTTKTEKLEKLENKIRCFNKGISIGAWIILFSLAYLGFFLPTILILNLFFSIESSLFLVFTFYLFLGTFTIVPSSVILIKLKRKVNVLKSAEKEGDLYK